MLTRYHLRPIAAAALALRLCTLWLAVTLLASTYASASPPNPKEYEIKAAFIYNFTKFVEWPPDTFANPESPIVIGVIGDSPCTQALMPIVQDRRINGRPLVVKTVDSLEQAKASQILFVGAAQEANFTQWAAQIQSKPILTVGESATFAQAGGTINFVPQEDKIRFEININSAERAGIKVSAQLQKLATAIRRSP